jgi:hypothetical protein
MELASLGIDTLRPKFVADKPLPVNEASFREEMIDAGWLPRVSSRVLENAPESERFHQSTTYSHQLDGDTLRFFVINSGRDLIAEYSVPRLVRKSFLNFQLASPSEAIQSVRTVEERLASLLPIDAGLVLNRFQRVDVAADVFAEEYRTGLISAGARFKIPGARKQEVVVYPNETAIIKSPSATFRIYNKGIEAAKKTETMPLSLEEEVEVQEALDKTRMRLEYVFRERGKGGYPATQERLENSIIDFVDALAKGFGTKAIRIGGLSQIRKQIDSLNIHEMTRASLYMFVVRYLALGSVGIKETMSSTAYYEIMRKVRQYGLHIDEMSSFEGTVDLNPLFEQIQQHPMYREIFVQHRENRQKEIAF